MMLSLYKPTAHCFADTARVALSLSCLLTSCAGVLDLDSPSTTSGGARMAPPMVLDGYGNPAPELPQPMAARTNPDDQYNEPGVRETHAVASESECYKMAQKFRQDSRKLELKRTTRSGDAQLPFLCVFEGEDAVDSYYQDRRYERDTTQPTQEENPQ